MNKLPIILDDLIEEELQNQIEDAMFDCYWKYASDNSLGSNTLEMKCRKFLSPLQYDISPSFIGDIKSPLNKKIYNKIIPLIQKGCNEIKFNIEKVERFYSAIHAVVRNKPKHDTIHINRNIPHLVMLYYVNDCDGDTILYDKTLEDISFDFNYPDDHHELNVEHRISPKKGRILFFDGRVYHAPSAPTKSVRCIITLDLFGEFLDGSYKFPAPKEKIKQSKTFSYS
jgi:hypothetical protein